MSNSKSNIYVSISDCSPEQTSTGEHVYRRPQHLWSLSVEPHKHHIPVLQRKHSEPIHYTAVLENGAYTIRTRNNEHGPVIIGNVLIAENAKTSPDNIHGVLKEKLTPARSNLAYEDTPEVEPEHWLRKALHILQAEKILTAFDVGELMTFCHSYAANRKNNEAPAMIAYPKLYKDHETKAKKHSFWVDYPMASKPEPRKGVTEYSSNYGGLM